jgi:hypothetical protein
MCVFLISPLSSIVLPLIHSVASDDDAMALPHPKVLNLAWKKKGRKKRKKEKTKKNFRHHYLGDYSRVVHLNLQPHHIATGGRSHQPRSLTRREKKKNPSKTQTQRPLLFV